MFIVDFKFIMQSTTPFTAIIFALLLIATIYIAIKCHARLHSIGTIAIVFGLLYFSVSLVHVFDTIQVGTDYSIHDLIYDKINSGEPITREDYFLIDSIWKYLVPPLANSFTILLWSTFDYLVSRILYIVRTPRI